MLCSGRVPSAADYEPSVSRINNQYSGLGSHLSASAAGVVTAGGVGLNAASIIRRVAGGEKVGPHYLHTVPDDALYNIMSYLDVNSVVAVAGMDLRMREVINTCDDVWRLKAVTDYAHLTLEERRAAAHWANPRDKYVLIRQRRYQSRASLGFERLRQADLDAGEREALTKRLPFHYFAESGFTVLVPILLFVFAFFLSRSDVGISVWLLTAPLFILQILVFGLLFMLWGHESHSYESDHGLVSLCLTHFFTDSPPVARKYTLAACMNGCFMLGTMLIANRISDLETAAALNPTETARMIAAGGWGWGTAFAPLWVLFTLLALPLAWNERSTINWRALWLLVALPHLISTVLLAISMDHPSQYYFSLGTILVPVFVSQAFAGFVLLRIALRFGCHVLWRGRHCVLVADPYDFGPDRDILDVVNAQQQNDMAGDGSEWRSSSVGAIPNENGIDITTPRCMLCSGQGMTALGAILAVRLSLPFAPALSEALLVCCCVGFVVCSSFRLFRLKYCYVYARAPLTHDSYWKAGMQHRRKSTQLMYPPCDECVLRCY